MRVHRDLTVRIRTRQVKTGASYVTARAHVMRERAALPAPEGREVAR